MKKSLTFRVISGVIVAATLLILPATASAAVRELTRPAPAGIAQAERAAPGDDGTWSEPTGTRSEPTGTRAERGNVIVEQAGAMVVEHAAPSPATLPFRLSVPGAALSGSYTRIQGSPQVTVSLKVTGQAPCGVLQTTRNGPADGIEWHTVGALCGPGTATFRTGVNRLWGSRALPSIRLCNGDSLGLAEGVDCDRFTPPRGA